MSVRDLLLIGRRACHVVQDLQVTIDQAGAISLYLFFWVRNSLLSTSILSLARSLTRLFVQFLQRCDCPSPHFDTFVRCATWPFCTTRRTTSGLRNSNHLCYLIRLRAIRFWIRKQPQHEPTLKHHRHFATQDLYLILLSVGAAPQPMCSQSSRIRGESRSAARYITSGMQTLKSKAT